MPSSLRQVPALRALFVAAALAAGCTPSEPSREPPPASPPLGEDAVMTLNGEPIRVDEIDALGELVSRLYPQYTRPHLRRLALVNRIFPLRALAGPNAQARANARARAAAALEHAARGEELGGLVESGGGWRDLGFELWSALVELDARPEDWVGPIEIPGLFLAVRVLERPAADHPERDGWRVSILEFPYLSEEDRSAAIERALDDSVLEILDPAWNEIVPEGWKYRMSGPSGG